MGEHARACVCVFMRLFLALLLCVARKIPPSKQQTRDDDDVELFWKSVEIIWRRKYVCNNVKDIFRIGWVRELSHTKKLFNNFKTNEKSHTTFRDRSTR